MEFEKMLDALEQGDREAFQQFYDRYGLPVYRYILKKTGDPERTRVLWKNVFRSLMDHLHNEPHADLLMLLLTAFADVQIAEEHASQDHSPEEQAQRLSSELMDELHVSDTAPAAESAAPVAAHQAEPEAVPEAVTAVSAPEAAHADSGTNLFSTAAAPSARPDTGSFDFFPSKHGTADFGALNSAAALEYTPRRAAQEPEAALDFADSLPHFPAAAPAAAEVPAEEAFADKVPAGAANNASTATSAADADTPPDSTQNASDAPPVAAAFYDQAAFSSKKRTHRGLIVLLIILIIIALIVIWGSVGYAMGNGLLPRYDLGYSWFNQHIFNFFPNT